MLIKSEQVPIPPKIASYRNIQKYERESFESRQSVLVLHRFRIFRASRRDVVDHELEVGHKPVIVRFDHS